MSGKYTGIRRFLTKRFILTITVMGNLTVLMWYGKLTPWPYIVGMVACAAYHDAANILQAARGMVPGQGGQT